MEKARYIFGDRFGSAAVLQMGTEQVAYPGPGQVLVRQSAVGVNFIDILARRGELGGSGPFRLGLEAAGEILAVAGDVIGVNVGDRIVYAGGVAGGYADLRLVDAARAVKLPNWLDDDVAAAIFFKALSADYLVHKLRPLSKEHSVLFYGAAGGVGSLAIPLLKQLGVTVIGAVGREEKATYATEMGCDRVVVVGRDNIPAVVRDATGGRGVDVAFDSIGKATIDGSLESLARFGLLVSFGWASGDPEPIAFSRLRAQGSVFLTRPTVAHYTESRTDLEAASQRVFAALNQKVYAAYIDAKLPLDEAGKAQELLETGAAKGSVILDPTA